jgi:hypothetical protein
MEACSASKRDPSWVGVHDGSRNESGAFKGTLVVETIAKIRRAYFVEGKSIKGICRDLRLSRKVVRKAVRTGTLEFRYERSEQPMPRLGPWKDALGRLLADNAAKPSRERLTLIRVL